MKKDILINLLLSLGSLCICFVIAEFVIRYSGHYDPDGDFISYGVTLLPYQLPASTIKQNIDEYLRLSPATKSIYDPLLGWSPRPNGVSQDGLYKYNSVGIRSAPTEYSINPLPGVLRIALFGDSFTYGAEVSFEETWGYLLENKLREKGLKAEVINFGEGGYGMDQAFLRWQTLGYQYAPDVVIFGLQIENVERNVNLLRPLLQEKTEIPFSKPRYILNDKGDLELINQPTIPLENIATVVENFDEWEFAQYEYFFQPECYQNHFWLQSRFISWTIQKISPCKKPKISYSMAEEPVQLAAKIIETFKQDVEARGAKFLIVYLPQHDDLIHLAQDKPLPYTEIFAALEKNNVIIYPARDNSWIKEGAKSPSLFNPLFAAGNHYSALGNQMVAEAIANFMMDNHVK